jgi:hypothetical protein
MHDLTKSHKVLSWMPRHPHPSIEAMGKGKKDMGKRGKERGQGEKVLRKAGKDERKGGVKEEGVKEVDPPTKLEAIVAQA